MFEWLEALKFWKKPEPPRVVSEEEFRKWSSLLTWIGSLQTNIDSIEAKWDSLAGRDFNEIELLRSVQRIARNFGANFARVEKKMKDIGIYDEFTEILATIQLEYKYLDRKHPKRDIRVQLQLVRKTVIELKEKIKEIKPKRPSVFG